MKTEEEKERQVQKLLRSNPLKFILQSADLSAVTTVNWNRYLPFLRYGNCWVPFHKTYCVLWAAIKWGCNYHWKKTDHFIMDLTNGEIVYNDWSKENE